MGDMADLLIEDMERAETPIIHLRSKKIKIVQGIDVMHSGLPTGYVFLSDAPKKALLDIWERDTQDFEEEEIIFDIENYCIKDKKDLDHSDWSEIKDLNKEDLVYCIREYLLGGI